MFFKPRQLSPLIFLLLSFATSLAQNHKVDSLVNILNKRSRIDTLSVNLMSEIAYQVYANNPSMADDYTQQVIYLSDSLKYKKGIGKGLWLTGLLHLQKDRVRSIDYFKQALAVAEEINDKADMANYLLAIGNTQSVLGDWEAADNNYIRALELAELAKDKALELKCLINIGRSFNAAGMYPQAIKAMGRAITLSKETGDLANLASCYNSIGGAHLRLNNYSVALEYLQLAFEVNEQLNNKNSMAQNLINMTGIRIDQKDYNGALEYASQAKKLYEEIGDSSRLSVAYLQMGSIYLFLDLDLSLEYLEKSLDLNKSQNITQNLTAMNNIGYILTQKGEYEEAIEVLNKSMIMSEKAGYKIGSAMGHVRLASCYFKINDIDKALYHCLKCDEISTEIRNIDLQKDNHQLLSEIYAKIGNYKKAYDHQKLFKQLSDSIFNADNVRTIADMESSFQFEKERKQMESEKLKRDLEIKNQKLVIIGLSTGSLLLLLFVLALYQLYVHKKRTNITLMHQKAKIEELNEEYITINEQLSLSNQQLTEAKDKIEKSEERLRLIIKNSNDIILLIGEDTKIKFVSDVATSLTGYSSEELKSSLNMVVHPEDIDILSTFWRTLNSKALNVSSIQFRLKHKHNGYRWFEAVAQNFVGNLALGAILANIRDIDVQKKAEQAFIEKEALQKKLLQLELEKINSELESNQKALASATLKLVHNAERDEQTVQSLEKVMTLTDEKGRESIRNIITNYKLQAYAANWEEFDLLFQKVHNNFYRQLSEQFPELTPNERKLCAFLRLNMGNKQIEQITFQSEEALKKARLRLKKKLNLDKDTNLLTFIQGL